MKFERLRLPEVMVFTPTVFRDHRGSFMETFRTSDIGTAVGDPDIEFVQGNESMSVPMCVRGLHYQLREPQGKLVRCISGWIYDVAVDVRVGSPTFGQWCAVRLIADEHKIAWIPPGFAHGFMTRSCGSIVAYECTTVYHEEWARAIRWDDPTIGIVWPIDRGIQPVMTNKDRAAPLLGDAELPKYDGRRRAA